MLFTCVVLLCVLSGVVVSLLVVCLFWFRTRNVSQVGIFFFWQQKPLENLEKHTRNVRLMNDENPCEQTGKRGELKKSGQNSKRIRKNYVSFC